MPELPEVETARSLIADHALHRRIVGVDDADTFVCRPQAMWCETSGIGPSAVPGPDLGIHLGMGGRIVVVSRSGQAAEGGGPRRRDAQPHKEEWNRFTLEFADGAAWSCSTSAAWGASGSTPTSTRSGRTPGRSRPRSSGT